jgi:RNA-binding protein Musashi
MDDFDFGLYDEETIENPIKTEIAIKPVAITQAIPVTTSPSATIDVPIQEPNPSNYTSEQCKMYLGGLSKETTRGTLILTSDTLKEYFLKFGPIAELSLLKDPISAISRGFGFVTFLEPRTLDRVLKQNHIIDHKMIQTKRVIPRAEEDRVEKIYVGGIPLGVDNEELKDFFVKFGEVLDAYIMFDPSTKQSQGWGFVTFNEFSGVEAVLDSNRKARLTIRKKRVQRGFT